MGDNLDILFWVVIMVVIALRGVSRSKRIQAPPEPGVEPPPGESRAMDRPPQKARGLRARWAEMAAELERQIQAQQTGPGQPPALGMPAEPPPDRMVLVPGRRVEASDRPLVPSAPVADASATSMTTAKASASRRRRSRGLVGLERYGALKRAVIFSEILRSPPGLDDVPSVEQRWEN